jgi:hypothetical protein
MRNHLLVAALLMAACSSQTTPEPSMVGLDTNPRGDSRDSGALHLDGVSGPADGLVNGDADGITDAADVLADGETVFADLIDVGSELQDGQPELTEIAVTDLPGSEVSDTWQASDLNDPDDTGADLGLADDVATELTSADLSVTDLPEADLPDLPCVVDTDCDDGNACTTDTCDQEAGCLHEALQCDDGNLCTDDSCAPATGCEHTAVSCDDDDACTMDSCDKVKGCLNAAVLCNDESACTTDSCVPDTGCQWLPVDCDDGNLCTVDSCKPADGCHHVAMGCDDNDKCTVDSCNPQLGCLHTDAAEQCGNGLDDDCDGLADCLDSDCFGPACAELCSGGQDEDGDGQVDCFDSDCFAAGCPETCDDGKDNDGDGAADCADTQCFGPPSCAIEAICDDGKDNDGDGLKDCQDSDCFGPLCPELCADKLDNDGDTSVDCADSDCPPGAGPCQESEVSCADGFDNDGDGKLDCGDADCTDDVVCGAEQCGDGVDNDDDGATDCADDDCPAGQGPCEALEANCQDGFDNDGDGTLDCGDSDCFGPACPELCGGSNDEDGDGLTDCQDSDCFGPQCPEICLGALDEDGDGAIDCADSDCFGPACAEVCDGPADVDGDGLIGCGDPDCFGPACPENCAVPYDEDTDGLTNCEDPDCFGPGCQEQCSGGLDEDGDGAMDCSDADCFGQAACAVETLCSDGLDNDADGQSDCDDADCFGPACPEVCDDSFDNDGDGSADCVDPDCFGPACSENCNLPYDEDDDGQVDCDDSDCWGPGCQEVCTGGNDEDGDGQVDCADSDCFGPPSCVTESICNDLADNDFDGLTDCKDDDCFGPGCPEVCGDGLDNDGDTQIDCSDADCIGPACPEQCANGQDDDGDGLADCEDDDCFGPTCPEICAGGLDEDGDGLFDCADSDCFGNQCTELCSGGLDEDGDAAIDCGDADCFGQPGCAVEALCADGLDNDGDKTVDCADLDCLGPACPEICTGGLDEDGDGATDCADSDCFGPDCNEVCAGGFDEDGDSDIDCNDSDCFGPACQEVCSGGLDEDGDGVVDCADSDCFGPSCSEVCTGGLDEDGDGAIDCADPDCFSPACPEVCDDGVDNDGDGSKDCADTDCIGPLCPEQCANSLDDDGDGLADCDDPDCAAECAEICDDGIDNDGDGAIDCADTTCVGTAMCLGDTCDNPYPVTEAGSYEVPLTGKTDATALDCNPGAGIDLFFTLILAQDADLSLSTQGSDGDTVIALRTDCNGGVDIGCNDDVDFRHNWARTQWNDIPAGSYIIVVDTHGDPASKVMLNVAISDPALPPGPTVDEDPLVRMPGTQHTDGVTLEGSNKCLNCHSGYANDGVEPGNPWQGSMMAQSSRDFLYLASVTVALQDSRWVLGTYNAGDLCLRCHFPAGWLAGRSEPTNASAMTGGDFDGLTCDTCHRQYDPHFVATYNGEREGNDWLNVWDETNDSNTPSQTAANETYLADIGESSPLTLFNGTGAFGNDNRPSQAGWTEAASGQYFVAAANVKRAPFADAAAKHKQYYSRFHKSRYFCATCHDVSNPVLANLPQKGQLPGQGPPLKSETDPAYSYGVVERTFSEFMLSKFGQNGGAEGSGTFAPDVFATSLPGNKIGRCQDCHMPDGAGYGANKQGIVWRPDDSVEHPQSGMPVHDLVGGNVFVTTVLASTDPLSANYDATNAQLLGQGPTVLTLDLTQGQGITGARLLEGAAKAQDFLERAATLEDVSYSPNSGTTSLKVVNHTGHKLISGFAEGRRMFLNLKLYQGNQLVYEVNPYDGVIGTLKGLSDEYSLSSPELGEAEEYVPELVYEMHHASSFTNEKETFHFVLGTSRWKDNRIPPAGFDIDNAPARLSEPVWEGQSAPTYFTDAEYAGGYDHVELNLPTGGDRLEVRLYYQTTSREYVEFLRDEINGNASTLTSPTPSGAAIAYVAQTDPFFDALKAWGDTIWQLWLHNKDLPGAAPLLMVEEIVQL